MDNVRKKRALELWEEGQRHHLTGGIDRAIELYSRSIELFPTAEAYTFRGWAYSSQGRMGDAIVECEKAIETDPSFGNPYNDIGTYLIAQGHWDEAEPWLQKAKNAPRYEARHYPYLNLARVYAERGQVALAIGELEAALENQPNEPSCLVMLERLRTLLN